MLEKGADAMTKRPRFKRKLWHRDKEELTKELESWLGENQHNPTASGLAESFLQERSDLFQGNAHDQQHVAWVEGLLQKTEAASRKREHRAAPDTTNIATRMLVLAEDEGAYLFGSDGEGFVRLSTDGRREIWPVSSQQFERFLTKLLFDHEGKPPGPTPLKGAIRLANALAIFERPQHELHNRVAWHDENLWFDLRDQEGEAVKVIAGEGWEIIRPPILFRRYRHQKPAIRPIAVEDMNVKAVMDRFLKLVHHDPKTRILHQVQLVTSFIPGIPHPVPNIHGEQGSAKTCYTEAVKKLVDPSIIATHMLSRTQKELVQCLAHHWMVVFDNVSDLTDWQSDVICRAVTGAGLQKRKLYTDEEDIIFSFMRVVALNGINVAAIRPDLLDRAILHEFPSIPIENRITVDEFWEQFDRAAPEIMGAIFTILSMAMKILPTVQRKGLYRMADFTRWGIAIAEAIGYERQDFIDEYEANLKGANLQALESHTVGVVLLELMVEYKAAGKDYIDTPTKVLKQLEEVAGTRVMSADWPANAQTLGRVLNRLKTNLERQGILFTRGRGDNREWVFTPIETAGQLSLEYFSLEEVGHDNDSAEGPTDNCDGSDGNTQVADAMSQPSELSVDDALASDVASVGLETHEFEKDKEDSSTVSSGDCDGSDIPTVIKKPFPRTVKQFEKWLSPLPNAGQRGFKESDAKKAHGEGHLKQLAKYVKKGWIEQRGSKPDQWWLSDTGKAALRGDVE